MKLNPCLRSLLLAATALLVAGASTSHALDITIVESRAGGLNVPWYHEVQGNWANSTAKSTAPGTTQASPSIGSRFATTEGAIFSVSPVLQDGATYTIDITHGTSSGIPTTFDVGVTATGGTVDVTSTPVFAQLPDRVWERVGKIVLDPGITTPTITFTKLTAGAGRFYADAVRFTLFDQCQTVPDLKTVNGPLAAGQTYVDVPGITNTAQTVTVYANGVQIGQKSSGVTVGVNRVTTSPLVQGQVITVTQTVGGTESCNPTTGQSVGGGPNPPMSIAITIRQTNLTDSAIGVNGGAPGSILKFIGATGAVGTLLAPLGAKTFYPSSEWQTVQFQRGPDPANPIDPTFNWNAADSFGDQLAYNFGVFDALIFTSPQDTGPFAIFIDEFRNGNTLIQGFEGATLGAQAVTFTQPSSSGTTSGFLLSQAPGTISPNISVVTNNTSDAGAYSLYLSWQFNTTNVASCLRLAAVSGTAGGTPNPIVDLRQPISFRMLILPVGQTVAPSAPFLPVGPPDQRVIRGGTISMRVNVRGTSPFTYQWRHNSTDIPGATSATLTLTNVQLSDQGFYTVYVENSLGNAESPPGTLTVEDVPYTDVMTTAWRLPAGSRPYLTNDNNTRSIAWSPFTGNLLVASRSANSNAIYVLDGNSGAFLYTLEPPTGGFIGGTLVLNQVVVANDGSVYAGNLTTDGVATNFRLYRWFGDLQGEPCVLVWEGNPANDPNVHLRWGDAMSVRSGGGGNEVFISSSGTAVAVITDFPSVVPVDIAGASAGALRLGLAVVPGDVPPGNILWGKTTGSPLLRVQIDAGLTTGTILDSFSGLNTMTAIGVNANGTLLGGVFVDNPDHLRLFDISTPGTITALDTEFFPSDNANANATGGVAFGNGKVYALDSNNGIIAMNLNTDCLPDRLTIEHSSSDVILRWNRAAFHLEGTATLGGGWTPITGGSPKTVPATGTQFFRLVCP